MQSQQIPQRSQTEPGDGTVVRSSGLPDLNSGKYPFEVVQELVDRAAWINIYAVPDSKQSDAAVPAADNTNDVIGISCSQAIHHLSIDLQLPTLEAGVMAANVLGQRAGTLDLRWMIVPYEFDASPDRQPPPTALDSSRPQRFAMQEATFTFGNGQDGFRSFGTGRTWPVGAGGRQQLVAAAIGNIVEGFGKFKGLEGVYVLSGEISPERGFSGQIMVRVVDSNGALRAKTALPPIDLGSDPEPGVTYLMMRSQKSGPSMRTAYSFTPDGRIRGLNVPQELRRVHASFAIDGSEGFRSEFKIGGVMGEEIGFVNTNPLVQGPDTGTGNDPFRFQGVGDYVLFDSERRTVGGFTAQFLEGRTFRMELPDAPGQIALRFGFFGPILSGTGCFSGVQGMLLGSTGVGISPHVFSNLYVLRLNDPDGRYRAADRAGG